MRIDKNKLFVILIGIIILIGVILRYRILTYGIPFWIDEAFIYGNFLEHDTWGLLGYLDHRQVAPPLYLLVSKLFIVLVPYMELATRIFPFMCGVCFLFVFYFLAKNVFKNKITVLFSMVLLSLNIVAITYSAEFKPYGLDALIAAFILLVGLKIDFSVLNVKKIILYTISVIILILFSTNAIFTLGALFLAKLLCKENRRSVFYHFLPIFLFFMIYYAYHLSGDPNIVGMKEGWVEYFPGPSLYKLAILAMVNINFYLAKMNFVIPLFLFFAGFFLLFKKDKVKAVALILPTLFITLASVLNMYPLGMRTLMFLMPSWLLLICIPLDNIDFSKNKVAPSLLLALFLLFFTPHLVYSFKYDIKPLNFVKDATGKYLAHLQSNLKSGQIVVVDGFLEGTYYFYKERMKYNIQNKEVVLPSFEEQRRGRDYYMDVLNQNHIEGDMWVFLRADRLDFNVITYFQEWLEISKTPYSKLSDDIKTRLYFVPQK